MKRIHFPFSMKLNPSLRIEKDRTRTPAHLIPNLNTGRAHSFSEMNYIIITIIIICMHILILQSW